MCLIFWPSHLYTWEGQNIRTPFLTVSTWLWTYLEALEQHKSYTWLILREGEFLSLYLLHCTALYCTALHCYHSLRHAPPPVSARPNFTTCHLPAEVQWLQVTVLWGLNMWYISALLLTPCSIYCIVLILSAVRGKLAKLVEWWKIAYAVIHVIAEQL